MIVQLLFVEATGMIQNAVKKLGGSDSKLLR